jgi:hypothetical protein
MSIPNLLRNPILQTPPLADALESSLITGLNNINTAGEVNAFVGFVTAPNWTSGSKSITGIKLMYTALVQSGGSVWQVSLRSMSRGTYPAKPSASIDQFWTGSVTGLSTNTPITHSFNTARTVSPLDEMAVVVKWSTFVAGASANVAVYDAVATNEGVEVYVSADSEATWTPVGAIPNMVFTCADGSELYFRGVEYFVTNYVTALTTTFTSQSTGIGIDSGSERGILWIPKKQYDLQGVTTELRLANTASSAQMTLYRDTTPLASTIFTVADNSGTANYRVVSLNLTSSIVVSPQENIRVTLAPITGSIGWVRFGFQTPDDVKRFYGNVEDNVAITNRVGTGSWNTPVSASASFTVTQFYGREVVPVVPTIQYTNTGTGSYMIFQS